MGFFFPIFLEIPGEEGNRTSTGGVQLAEGLFVCWKETWQPRSRVLQPELLFLIIKVFSEGLTVLLPPKQLWEHRSHSSPILQAAPVWGSCGQATATRECPETSSTASSQLKPKHLSGNLLFNLERSYRTVRSCFCWFHFCSCCGCFGDFQLIFEAKNPHYLQPCATLKLPTLCKQQHGLAPK